MVRLSVILGLFIWALGAVTALAGVQADSRNFRLISETTVDTQTLLTDLEAFRRAVLTDLDLSLSDEAEPLTLSIIDDPELFGLISPGGQTAAIYLRSVAGNDIVLGYSSQPGHFLSDAIEPGWLRLVLRHETVHHILESRYPRKLPIWLSEGLAEYYATYRSAPDGSVRFGEPFPEQDMLSGTAGWLPMRTVIESMSDYPRYQDYSQDSYYRSQRLYYGQAWALAHFVLDQPEGLTAIHRFVDGWPKYGDSEDSFERAFGMRYNSLEERMRDRLTRGQTRIRTRLSPAPLPAIVRSRAVSRAELDRNALRLLIRFAHLDDRAHAVIRQRLANASAAYPPQTGPAAHPEIILSRALRAWRIKEWGQSDRYADQLLAMTNGASTAATNWRRKAYKIKAKTAYGRVSEDQLNDALWADAERAARRALDLDPNDATMHLFRVAVTLPDTEGLPPAARQSLDWLTRRNTRFALPHEAMMMVPALIYEGRLDRADAVLDSASRWTTDPADQFVIERLRSNVAVERSIAKNP